MARYYGIIGYGVTEKTKPGVWSNTHVTREVYGDIYKASSSHNKTESLNDDISISMEISFLADPYAMENFSKIKYATYIEEKWKVKSIRLQYPRIVLTLGGVYNDG